MVGAPRNIVRLPSMCAMTNPTRMRPVTAITTFLPTMVPHSEMAGLADHTPRGAAAKLVLFEVDVIMLPEVFLIRFSFGSIHAQTLSMKGNHFYFTCGRIPGNAGGWVIAPTFETCLPGSCSPELSET